MPLTVPPQPRASGVVTTASMQGAKGKFAAANAYSSVAWPSANLALLYPFEVYDSFAVNELFFNAGTTPGTTNYDLGIYDEAFRRLASIGATASVNTTDLIQPSGGGALSVPLVLPVGRYYIAMSSAATTLTVRAQAPGNGIPRALGMQQMASAHPLPTTVTPASLGATNVVPLLGMTTTTNIL